MNTKKTGVIGILTGGGDVPGLNPAIRAVTIRATREGYKVIGIRRGWAGLIDVIRDPQADNSNNFQVLTEEIVNKAGRTGGTFLHTSRTESIQGQALTGFLRRSRRNILTMSTI
jgi:6-phosphofructokinase 1